MGDVLIGIDIGTSACKAVAFSPIGEVLAMASANYKVYYKKPSWAEQDPLEWWEAVTAVLKKITREINANDIKGIGIDGQSWSAIPIDKHGDVLANTPIWMDTRAEEICVDLEKKIGREEIFKISGNPLMPSYTLPKILWFKKYMPQMYKNTEKFLQSNSFIAFRLTGKMTQDKSQGYGLSCYNIRNNEWDFDLCEKMGIKSDLLPQIFDCNAVIGNVTTVAAEECGLAAGIPVVAGGLDAACGALGAGVIHAGETQEQGGQAGGMSICISEYIADERLILSSHVVPNMWLLQGGSVGGGGVMNWFEKEFGEEERAEAEKANVSSFKILDEKADKISHGSEGLVFLPYMAGERSPIWDASAKAVYYGADYSKTKAHFIRASMEGVAFALKHNLDVSSECGAIVNELRAVGGAANSKVWTQIKADITGKSIIVPSANTATALGAAILAGIGTGIYKSYDDAVEKTVRIKKKYTPNMLIHEDYKKNYKVYLALYSSLKDIMHGDI